MPYRLSLVADNENPLTVQLHDGIAELMGDGLFILFQADEEGKVSRLVLTEGDLRKLLNA